MGKHSSAQPSQTPAESMAYKAAQPFLQEYNSGVLNPADQAVVNLGDTNSTATTLQNFAQMGMLGSSALGLTTGVVTKGGPSGGMQAGAGSSIDLSKLSNTQKILQSDLQIGMDYLQISSGQAANLAGIQQEQSALLANALGTMAGAAVNIFGPSGGNGGNPGTDIMGTQSQNNPFYTGNFSPAEEVTDSSNSNPFYTGSYNPGSYGTP